MEDLLGNDEEADQDLDVNIVGKDFNVSPTPPQVTSIPLTDCPLSDAVFKELSVINGQINGLKRKDLINKLKKYHLNHKGDINVLRKRLKNHFKIKKLTKAKLMEKQNLQPYYVVIDFEATCQENNPVDFKYEIIEFPAILVHTETLGIVDVFHSYVKPVIHPKLTGFCTDLTGITQEEVDKAPPFPEVLRMFESWLSSHGLLSSQKFIVTDGPWDMGRFLFLQCKLSGLKYPAYAREWTNVRRIFRNFYKYHQGGSLEDMVRFVGLKFEGKPHCGLDDSYNIARMFLHLLRDGALVRTNERITHHCRSHNNMHVIPVSYKKPLNTRDDVTTLRAEMAELNLSLSPSDTEPSEDELGVSVNPTSKETAGIPTVSPSQADGSVEKVTSLDIPASGPGKSKYVKHNGDSVRTKNEHSRSSADQRSVFRTPPSDNVIETFYGNAETYDRIMEILHSETKRGKSENIQDKSEEFRDTAESIRYKCTSIEAKSGSLRDLSDASPGKKGSSMKKISSAYIQEESL